MPSLKEFINKRRSLGHIPTARFNVSMTFNHNQWSDKSNELLKEKQIEFSLASINLPTIRGNYDQVYFDTMPVEVFKNFTYDPDFSMIVICDNLGKIYKEFLRLIQHDKEDIVDETGKFSDKYEGNFNFKQKIDPEISLTVEALADGVPGLAPSGVKVQYFTGMKIKLAGVYIKGIGNLDFSNNSSDIVTFSVNAAATSFEILTNENPSEGDFPVEATFPGEEGYTEPPEKWTDATEAQSLAAQEAEANAEEAPPTEVDPEFEADKKEWDDIQNNPEEAFEKMVDSAPEPQNPPEEESPPQTNIPDDKPNNFEENGNTATAETTVPENPANTATYRIDDSRFHGEFEISRTGDNSFDVEIREDDGRKYTVEVTQNDSGEAKVNYENIRDKDGNVISYSQFGRENGLNWIERQGAAVALDKYVNSNFNKLADGI